jgi:predicted RND superfamily exporter protein
VLKTALLVKFAFWLTVIGFIALIAPNPTWPEWLARMILSAGIALAFVTLGLKYLKK